MDDIPESQLRALGERLLKLSPLEERNLDVLTETSGSFWRDHLYNTQFWATRRTCSYSVVRGMFPGTDSVFVDDADQDDLNALAEDLREEAMLKIAEVLALDVEAADLVRLNAHPTGDVDVLFGDGWQIVLQSAWRTGEYSDSSAVVINFLVTRLDQFKKDQQ